MREKKKKKLDLDLDLLFSFTFQLCRLSLVLHLASPLLLGLLSQGLSDGNPLTHQPREPASARTRPAASAHAAVAPAEGRRQAPLERLVDRAAEPGGDAQPDDGHQPGAGQEPQGLASGAGVVAAAGVFVVFRRRRRRRERR